MYLEKIIITCQFNFVLGSKVVRNNWLGIDRYKKGFPLKEFNLSLDSFRWRTAQILGKMKLETFPPLYSTQYIIRRAVPAPSFFKGTPLAPAWAPPVLKSLCTLPSVLFYPLLRYFRQFTPPSHKSLLP